MHCVFLADLAAVIAQHGQSVLYRRDSVPPPALTDYWVASRTRLDLWHQAITRNRIAYEAGNWLGLQRWWNQHLAVLEEVMVSDMLTRVVAALAAELDQQAKPASPISPPLADAEHASDRGAAAGDATTSNVSSQHNQDISPITDAIQQNHLEVRNRVQQLMLNNRGCRVTDAVRLNRLRTAVERWTDTLLGRMSVSQSSLRRYAFDASRASQHHSEFKQSGHPVQRQTVSLLMNAAMHDALKRRCAATPALPQANRSVAESILLMLRPDMFDSLGTLKSLWLHRIEIDCQRTSRVVEELMASDIDQAQTSSGVEVTHDQAFHRWYLA